MNEKGLNEKIKYSEKNLRSIRLDLNEIKRTNKIITELLLEINSEISKIKIKYKEKV